jgi:hypothetical protein
MFLSSYNGVCKKRVREVGEWRGTARAKPQESICSSMPWRGALAALIQSPGTWHIQRDRFFRPSGRESEGEKLANLAGKEGRLILV